MVKLIIQIPCKNEEETLPQVVKELPTHIDGIDIIEYQVIDDGSGDRTSQVAKELWIHHIIRFTQNKGLWFAFKAWVENALKFWADILVNTDADNQYPSRYISDLVQPILAWTADIVIGDRNPSKIEHFSPLKKFFQSIGNVFVGYVAGIPLKDSVSGFRAYNRASLLELNITSRFSYVVDTIVQAVKKWLKIAWTPITVNLPTRESRLFKNIFQHIRKTTINLVRVYIMYEPYKMWVRISIPFFVGGAIVMIRFLCYYLAWSWAGKVQSLILGSLIMQVGISIFILGFIASITANNRFLIEENLKMLKEMKYEK